VRGAIFIEADLAGELHAGLHLGRPRGGHHHARCGDLLGGQRDAVGFAGRLASGGRRGLAGRRILGSVVAGFVRVIVGIGMLAMRIGAMGRRAPRQ